VPATANRVDLGRQVLAPGFVDLQVNGGGGVLLNDDPSVATIGTIAAAHRHYGTTGLLPTLITADRATTARAIEAVRITIERGAVPGTLGIHLEGPHLNPARGGVHDPALMRPIEAADIELYASLGVGRTLVTLAPEVTGLDAIRELTRRGVVVAAGHTDAGPDILLPAIDAGLRGFTHLFNAMSPLQSRAPGTVGTALATPGTWCGLILDGHHVDPLAARVARRAKSTGELVLVTDAMATVGTTQTAFRLGELTVEVRDGRCTTPAGRLAGSCLDMASAVRNAVAWLAVPLETALQMASTWPAAVLGLEREVGRIAPGMRADLVLLDAGLQVRGTWIAGARQQPRTERANAVR
jgi:N-acetylglucosamine-6-phosphate deacetylase